MQLTDAASPSSRRHRRGDRSPPFATVARPDPAMPVTTQRSGVMIRQRLSRVVMAGVRPRGSWPAAPAGAWIMPAVERHAD